MDGASAASAFWRCLDKCSNEPPNCLRQPTGTPRTGSQHSRKDLWFQPCHQRCDCVKRILYVRSVASLKRRHEALCKDLKCYAIVARATENPLQERQAKLPQDAVAPPVFSVRSKLAERRTNCILQLSLFVVGRTRVGEDRQYGGDHETIIRGLGGWPLSHDNR